MSNNPNHSSTMLSQGEEQTISNMSIDMHGCMGIHDPRNSVDSGSFGLMQMIKVIPET